MSRLATPLSVLAVAGASLALVACGSSSGGGASTGASTTAGGAQKATANAKFEQFRSCLKDNGVTLPDRGRRPGGQGGYGPPPGGGTATNGAPPAGGPGFLAGGAHAGKLRKAMQACAKYRPQGRFGGNGARARLNIKAFTPYLNCLKAQGLAVKVSDGFNALRSLKRDDPKVQAAFKACQSKIPQRPNVAGAGTTTNGAT